jgi:hypothetical protein
MGAYQTTIAYQTKSSTVSSSVVGISDAGWSWTTGYVALAERAVITSRSAGVMVRWDGGDPTSTLGHLIAQNGTLEVLGMDNIANLKFIRESGSDAVVSVTLEK